MCQTWLLSVICGFFKGLFQNLETLHIIGSGSKTQQQPQKIFCADVTPLEKASRRISRASPRPSSVCRLSVQKKFQAKKEEIKQRPKFFLARIVVLTLS